MKAVECIRGKRSAIIRRWEDLARQNVPAARSTEPLALRDHLPQVIDRIVEALEGLSHGAGEGAKSVARLSLGQMNAEHGRHRAATKGYTVDQVIREYFLLQKILKETLCGENLWEGEIVEAVHTLVEECILDAALEFVEAVDSMQEKMLASLIHDLRTPLAGASLSLKLLQECHSEPDRRAKLEAIAVEGVDRGCEMLNDLIDTAMIKAGDGLLMHFEENDFTNEVHLAAEEAKRVYGDRIKWKRGNAIPGVFDGAAIRRILENLISNAVRYGNREKDIRINLEEKGGQVSLSVHNHGEPIPETDRESIFTFFSPPGSVGYNSERRWGVGLAFVKLAVEGHHGSIRLRSDPRDGTLFELVLPKRGRSPGKERARLLP